jgi:hypothetical protein
VRWPRGVNYLGLPDVYSTQFATDIDAAANSQCAPHKSDPLVLGYFIGNEPPWNGRESELCNLILTGPDTATKSALKDFLAPGDTPMARREFVIASFRKYLEIVCRAVRKYDPNRLVLGIRFGGRMADEVMIAAQIFDVCSINVYEYEPTKQIIRAARLSGRPILIGEFHIGVPADGLAAGLVQAKDQTERGIAYRYYVEQAASLPWLWVPIGLSGAMSPFSAAWTAKTTISASSMSQTVPTPNSLKLRSPPTSACRKCTPASCCPLTATPSPRTTAPPPHPGHSEAMKSG